MAQNIYLFFCIRKQSFSQRAQNPLFLYKYIAELILQRPETIFLMSLLGTLVLNQISLVLSINFYQVEYHLGSFCQQFTTLCISLGNLFAITCICNTSQSVSSMSYITNLFNLLFKSLIKLLNKIKLKKQSPWQHMRHQT